jgi:hypothetical protein
MIQHAVRTSFSVALAETSMEAVPVAGRDAMLHNLSGAHAPFLSRNIVILPGNAGEQGAYAREFYTTVKSAYTFPG